MRIAPFVLSLGLLAPVAAHAAPPDKPDFSSFAFLVGTWSCSTTKDTEGAGTGKTHAFTAAADPSGYWIVAKSEHVTRYLTHDAKTGKWVATALTTDGGSYSATSLGWSGSSVEFTDSFNSDGSPLGYAVLTKQSEREYTLRAGDGSSSSPSSYEETCKKS